MEDNFLEDLKHGVYTSLNKEGIDKVVEIIKEKDKEIDNLNELIKELKGE